MLTNTQAKTIFELDCIHVLHEDASIEPAQMFPGQPGIARRIASLERAGYLKILPGQRSTTYTPNMPEIKAAWAEWSKKNGWPNPADFFGSMQ